MTVPGDYPGEMDRLRTLDDNDIDALLAGRASADDPDLDRLAKLIDGVKLATVQPIDAAVEQRHVAAIVDAAHAASDASPARVRRVPLWTKIAAATVAAVAATGSLAAADQLPQPAQDAVASVAERVGMNLPSSEDEDVAVTEDERSGEKEGDDTESKRVNEDVRTELEDDSLEGRDKGAAVSDAADENRRDGNTPAAENRQDEADNPPGAGERGTSHNPNGYGAEDHPTGPPSDRP
ncbi:MAG: hypothetical protein ACRDKJ_03500 [Actinomycetota bacterium]